MQRDLSVTLTLTEEEALYVLAALGKTTGPTPNVYGPLHRALVKTGYDPDFLYRQDVAVIP